MRKVNLHELETELEKWSGEIPLPCDVVAAMVAELWSYRRVAEPQGAPTHRFAPRDVHGVRFCEACGVNAECAASSVCYAEPEPQGARARVSYVDGSPIGLELTAQSDSSTCDVYLTEQVAELLAPNTPNQGLADAWGAGWEEGYDAGTDRDNGPGNPYRCQALVGDRPTGHVACGELLPCAKHGSVAESQGGHQETENDKMNNQDTSQKYAWAVRVWSHRAVTVSGLTYPPTEEETLAKAVEWFAALPEAVRLELGECPS